MVTSTLRTYSHFLTNTRWRCSSTLYNCFPVTLLEGQRHSSPACDWSITVLFEALVSALNEAELVLSRLRDREAVICSQAQHTPGCHGSQAERSRLRAPQNSMSLGTTNMASTSCFTDLMISISCNIERLRFQQVLSVTLLYLM